MGRSADNRFDWDPEDYSRVSTMQKKWGRELLAKLHLHGDERVLDIGCGDGRLAVEMAERLPTGSIVGIDSSEEMIAFARRNYPPERFPGLTWLVMDARELAFQNEFDVVFSNAVLHWIADHVPVLEGIKGALRPGGRILLQMGGRGNAGEVVEVLGQIMRRDQWRSYFSDFAFAYGFYGPDEYKPWLELVGLTPIRVELISKDMTFKGERGLVAWIRTTWLPFTQKIPEEMREVFIQEIVDGYLKTHPPGGDGLLHVRAMRLEVEAENPA